MKAIKVRTLFKLSKEEIKELKTPLTVEFEDGVIKENLKPKYIILFRHLLDFINNYNIPITFKMYPENYLTSGYFTQGTYLKVYSTVYKEYIERFMKPNNNNSELIYLLKDMYKAIDVINRELVRDNIEYVIDVEIIDILEVQFERELLEAIAKTADEKTREAINNTYNVLDKIIKKDKFMNNPMRLLYLSGAVSKDQIKQLLGSRGFLTEMDGRLFEEPMTNSFTLGFKNIYEAAIESRAGAKALLQSGKAIQTSEYMSREIQLLTMVIERLYVGDCGHPTYVDFYINPEEYDEFGNQIRKSDLPNLVGKIYLDPETGEEKVITGDEIHLLGKAIKIRSALYCGLADKKKICSACLGDTAFSIFPHQNLGVIMSNRTAAKISQSILSIKHLLKSATAAALKLPDIVKKYFIIKNDKLYLKANTFNKNTSRLYIKIPIDRAWGLLQTSIDKNVMNYNLTKMFWIDEAELIIDNGKTRKEILLPLKSGKRVAYLTAKALIHVIKHGYKIEDDDYFLIDLTEYDRRNPVFFYEQLEFDYASLAEEFKKRIKYVKYKKVGDKIRSEFTPHVFVEKLFELVNRKLDINLSQLEVIAYALTIYDRDNQNYDLGRNSKTRDMVGLKEAIDFRSIGASYGWDNLRGKVLHPIMFKKEHKPATPMDVFFMPNEVIENDKKYEDH